MDSTGAGKHREYQPEYGLRMTAQRELREGHSLYLIVENKSSTKQNQPQYQSRHLKVHQFTHSNSHFSTKEKGQAKISLVFYSLWFWILHPDNRAALESLFSCQSILFRRISARQS